MSDKMSSYGKGETYCGEKSNSPSFWLLLFKDILGIIEEAEAILGGAHTDEKAAAHVQERTEIPVAE